MRQVRVMASALVSGPMTWARLAFRQQRWELVLVVLAVAGLVGCMLWFANTLDAMRAANADCLAGVRGGFLTREPPAACQAIVSGYLNSHGEASVLGWVVWGAPFALGVILGAPLVAREIEGRTAQLAWSLSRSRAGWLLRRAAFVALFALALLAVLSLTNELLTAAMLPDRSLGEDFTSFGRRGLPVVARGLAAIMIGVLVGALIGRVLPALLASAIVIPLVFTGLSFGHDQWNRADATLQRRNLEAAEPAEAERTGLGVAYGVEMLDGRFLTYDEASASEVAPNLSVAGDKVYASEADIAADRFIGYNAWLMIPGGRYSELVLRDSAVAALVGVATFGITAGVVRRRRPD